MVAGLDVSSRGARWGADTPSSMPSSVPSETEVRTDCMLATWWAGRALRHLHTSHVGAGAGTWGRVLGRSGSRACPRGRAGAPCVSLGATVAASLWPSRPGPCVRGAPSHRDCAAPRAASRPPTFLTVVPGCLGSCQAGLDPCCPAACVTGVPAPSGAGRTERLPGLSSGDPAVHSCAGPLPAPGGVPRGAGGGRGVPAYLTVPCEEGKLSRSPDVAAPSLARHSCRWGPVDVVPRSSVGP